MPLKKQDCGPDYWPFGNSAGMLVAANENGSL
jgi:hypothetical protein